MKGITRENFETFLVDYWDGQLSPAREEMLMRFLDQNPDLRKEVEGAEEYTVHPESFVYDRKEFLLKPVVNEESIDEFLAGELEHQLLPHQQRELDQFMLNHSEFERDRKLFSLTRIKADLSLVYPDKHLLRKGVVVPFWVKFGSVGVAACLILGMSAVWFNSKPELPGSIATSESFQTIVSVPDINIPVTLEDAPQLAVNNTLPPRPYRKNIMPVITVEEKQVVHEPKIIHIPRYKNDVTVPVSNASENFASYGRNRSPNDFLQGLVNSYLAASQNEIPEELNNVVSSNKEEPIKKESIKKRLSKFAGHKLKQVVKDDAFLATLESEDVTLKAKAAQTFAMLTGRATKGRVKVESIVDEDGSLTALSFSSGKYNYTKKF